MNWCRWCGGRGCVACPQPKPRPSPQEQRSDPATGLLWSVATPEEADPEGWRVLKAAFGREALQKAFGPGGGGLAEIERTIAEAQAQSDARAVDEKEQTA